MNKKAGLIVACLGMLVFIGVYSGLHSAFGGEVREEVVIASVLDGDTVRLADGRSIRMLNINAPEKKRAGADEATAFLKEYENETVFMDNGGKDIYGRTLGRLFTVDETYLNLALVEEGLVHAYLVDDSEIKRFARAEEEARERGSGIWVHSPYYGCLVPDINYAEEYVDFVNNCPVSLSGWTMKDASTSQYTFKNIAKEEFRVYSGEGRDTHNEYYWNRGNAWNDDGDTIYIRDGAGLLVYYDTY